MMVGELYLVRQEAWDAVPELRGVTRRSQPIVQTGPPWGPYAGMVMLAFPYHWWKEEDLIKTFDPLAVDWGDIPPDKDEVISTVNFYLNHPDSNLEFSKATITLRDRMLQVKIPYKERDDNE